MKLPQIKVLDLLKPNSRDLAWQEFIAAGNAILPQLLEAVEYCSVTNEAISSPLYDTLGWNFTRFGHSSNSGVFGYGFPGEDGNYWQVKVFGKSPTPGRTGRYYAPKSCGDRIFYPIVPQSVRDAISDRYNCPRSGDEAWSNYLLAHPIIPLSIHEGTKKVNASFVSGTPAVSLFGQSCGVNRDGSLKDPLLAKLCKSRRIIIVLDRAPTPKKQAKTNKYINRLAKAIARAGGTPVIPVWDLKEGEKIDDIAIAHGHERVTEILDNALDYHDWLDLINKPTLKCRYFDTLKYTPSESLNSRYLPSDILLSALKYDVLLAIKSGTGTGKTTSLALLTQHANALGLRVIVIGYRNVLLRSYAELLPDSYLLIDGDQNLIEDSNKNLLLCHHSSGKLSPEIFNRSIVIIDECHSVTKDIVYTPLKGVADRRRHHISHLSNCLANAHSIICLDANLTDLSTSAVSKLHGRDFNTVIKVENTYQSSANITMYKISGNSPDVLKKDIVERIVKGEKILVTSNSKNLLQTLRQMAIDYGISSDDICLVTQETVGEAHQSALMANPNQYLLNQPFKLVLLSPTGESGIDFSIPHFDRHYDFNFANQPIDKLIQRLGRERNFTTCPKHVWIEDRAQYSQRGYSTQAIAANERDYAYAASQLSGQSDDVALLAADYPLRDHYHHWEAANEIEKSNYYELAIERLSIAGYQITIVDPSISYDLLPDAATATAEVKAAKAAVHLTTATNYLEADESDLTSDDANRILNSRTATQVDRVRASKTIFAHAYPELDKTLEWKTREFWEWRLKHANVFTQLETLYLLLNPHLAKIKLSKNINNQAKRGGILRDLNQRAILALTVELAGLPKLIGKTYREGDPLVAEVVGNLERAKGVISKRGSQSQIAYLHRIAESVGLIGRGVQIRQADGTRHREYHLELLHTRGNFEPLVWTSIELRSLAQYGEILSQTPPNLDPETDLAAEWDGCQDEELVTAPEVELNLSSVEILSQTPPNIFINNGGSVTDSNPDPQTDLAVEIENVWTIELGAKIYSHADRYHVRGNDRGILEQITAAGEMVIRWLSDGCHQVANGIRTYASEELIEVVGLPQEWGSI